jgi:hypothetical protein
MTDTRLPKDRHQSIRELRATLTNLRLACDQWELGYMERSYEIARCLRVLLYDYGTSRSLFAQLNLKAVPFFTTPGAVVQLHGRDVRMLVTKTLEIVPAHPSPSICTHITKWEPRYFRAEQDNPLDAEARSRWRGLPFIKWWAEALAATADGGFSRADLVLAMSNELSGTHSAERIRPATAALLQGTLDHFRINVPPPEGQRVQEDEKISFADALIRQVAYEVQRTIERHHAELSPSPIVAMPIPKSRRPPPGFARVQQVEPEIRSAFAAWDTTENRDRVVTHEIRCELYWYDRGHELAARGL